jgi:transcriptional regulator with XRE-family HTH domain
MVDTNMPNVGQAIRTLRERQKFSLRQLSQHCGLSINAISKIERGETSPTVASLHKLASALGVHITDIFTQRPEQAIVFTPHANTTRIRGQGMLIEGLGNGLPNQKLEAFRMLIEPGASTTSDPSSHSGDEFVHCLEGELEYIIGHESFTLKAGDSLVFKASQPHSWRNNGTIPVKVLLVFETDQVQPVPHRLYHEQ